MIHKLVNYYYDSCLKIKLNRLPSAEKIFDNIRKLLYFDKNQEILNDSLLGYLISDTRRIFWFIQAIEYPYLVTL